MKSFLLLVLTAAVSIASPALTFADTIVFDRGLPTANLNNAAGALRSNVAWTDSEFATGWFVGDDFTIGGTGTSVISDLRVWVVGTTSGAYNNGNYADAAFSLWTGEAGALTDPLTVRSTASVLSQVYYAGGATYQGSSGSSLNLYALDFGLNWTVDNATTYRFGVSATDGSSNYVPVFLHASNAPLSGSPQQGADGSYLGFDPTNDWAGNYTCDSGNSVTCGGWDKSSDINVQIEAVPEPGSMMLFATGLVAVATKVRNRRLKK